MSTPKKEEQMRSLERSIAFEWASSAIESNTLHLPDSPDRDDIREWWDLDDAIEEFKDQIAEAVEYLEWRGLLLRDPGHPQHVSIRDEHEAGDAG